MSFAKPVCVNDYEEIARHTLPRNAWDYYASGADSMQTLADNTAAFSKIRLRPRILVDVSNVSMTTSVLGHTIRNPICVAPSAMQRMAADHGECANARACAAMKNCMILSSWSTTSLEEVAAAGNAVCSAQEVPSHLPSPVRWFQLYVYKDRATTYSLVKRAEK
ncbi:hypothetical protein H4R34_006416, partial [Dimargaris verticillata]